MYLGTVAYPAYDIETWTPPIRLDGKDARWKRDDMRLKIAM